MVHCGKKGMHMVRNNTQTGCGEAFLVLMGPKCAKKTIPPSWTADSRQVGFVDFCQILSLPSVCLSRNRDSSDQTTFLSTIQLSSFGECYTFCDDSVQTGYLNSCILSVSLNKSGHSQLNSQQLTFTGCFFLCGTILSTF